MSSFSALVFLMANEQREKCAKAFLLAKSYKFFFTPRAHVTYHPVSSCWKFLLSIIYKVTGDR